MQAFLRVFSQMYSHTCNDSVPPTLEAALDPPEDDDENEMDDTAGCPTVVKVLVVTTVVVLLWPWPPESRPPPVPLVEVVNVVCRVPGSTLVPPSCFVLIVV